MKIIQKPSPNFDERNSLVEMLVLHYTGMKSGAEAIARLCDSAAKVSAHYVVEENGDIYQLVDESKRAWHAGISFWRGRENLNACSIGIEIVNPGHEFGYRKFTKVQYEALVPLCQQIKNRWKIKDIDIVAHSDIAPDRKQDPGELFDWELLAKNGVGLWANQKLETRNQESDLTDLGYKIHDTASITAFQRHWRQNNVSGQWDEECATILTNLKIFA